MKPILLVTNHAPPARVPAFAALHEQVGVSVALYGGRARHGGLGGAQEALPFPHAHVRERDVLRLAASGDYCAVIAATGGRVALPAAWRGARRAGVPFVLWASLWAHPRTPAHLLSWPLLARIYRRADAVATYGPHASAYVRAHGARNVHEAPQAVDNAFWATPVAPGDERRHAPFQALFAGRMAHEKGIEVLLEAWRICGFDPAAAALVLAGDGPLAEPGAPADPPGVVRAGRHKPDVLRNFYAGSDVVVLASIATRDFREPWGLACNEAMNQGTPPIVTDAVGAAAGGLVRNEHTGLVVPHGDATALAAALQRLQGDAALRARLAEAGRAAVSAYTPKAWAEGMAQALSSTR